MVCPDLGSGLGVGFGGSGLGAGLGGSGFGVGLGGSGLGFGGSGLGAGLGGSCRVGILMGAVLISIIFHLLVGFAYITLSQTTEAIIRIARSLSFRILGLLTLFPRDVFLNRIW